MACIEEHLSIPLVEEVEKMFPVNFGLNTTDSGASMLKAEQGLQAARPHQLRLHMPCCTHKVSTVQGRAYGPIDVGKLKLPGERFHRADQAAHGEHIGRDRGCH